MNPYPQGQQPGTAGGGQTGSPHGQQPPVNMGPQPPSYLPVLIQEPKPKLRWVRLIVSAAIVIAVAILLGTLVSKVVSSIWAGLGDPPAMLFPGDSWRVFVWIVGLGVFAIVVGRLIRKVLG